MASAVIVSTSGPGRMKGGTYLLAALNEILKDDGFKLGTNRMRKALEVAEKMKNWIEIPDAGDSVHGVGQHYL